MTVCVLGAAGRVGRIISSHVFASGHAVRGVVHRPETARVVLDLRRGMGPGARIIAPAVGDVLDADGLVELFRGCDTVVNATGSPVLGPAGHDVDRDGTAAVIRAMRTAGVRRLIHLSCMYAHRPADAPAAFAPVWEAKRDAEATVEDSDLDWTIVRAGPLVDSGAAGQLSLATHLDTLGPVSREDVAAVVGSCIALGETAGKAFDVAGGTTYLLTALDVLTGRRPR